MDKTKIMLNVLTGTERDGWLHPGIVGFIFGAQKASRQINFSMLHNIKPVDAARNLIAANFLKSDCDWLVTIDNDMAPPVDLLDMIDCAEEHMDILVPRFYTTANVVFGDAPAQLGIVVGWRPRASVDPEAEWVELDMASGGIVIARRRVFEQMTKPFFKFVYDDEGQVTECEDLYFSRRAREAGLGIWGNQKFYVEHYKNLPLSFPARTGLHWLNVASGRFPAADKCRAR